MLKIDAKFGQPVASTILVYILLALPASHPQIESGKQCSRPCSIPFGEVLTEQSMLVRQIQVNYGHTQLSARPHADVRTERNIRADSVQTTWFTAVFMNRSA